MADIYRRSFIAALTGIWGFVLLKVFIRSHGLDRLKGILKRIWPGLYENNIQREKLQTDRSHTSDTKHTQVVENPVTFLSELPKKIGAFVAEKEIISYPNKELGASLGYNTHDNIAATIYVYDMGEKNIPDGIDSIIINSVFNEALEEIKNAESMGEYQNVKIILNEPIGEFLCAVLSYDKKDNKEIIFHPVKSELYVTGKSNHIIKVRISYQDQKNIRPQIDQLLYNIY